MTISSIERRAQRVNLRARQQRGVHFKRRIFRGRADQDNVAALDIRKKRVLLRFVEAMNFVDEHDRAAPELAGALRIGHHRLDFFDASENGAEGNKIGLRETRDQARQRRFADPGRAPQNQRLQLIALDLDAQRLSRREDVLLADEAFPGLGPHAFGERTLRIVQRIPAARNRTGSWSVPLAPRFIK